MISYTPSNIPEGGQIYLNMSDVIYWLGNKHPAAANELLLEILFEGNTKENKIAADSSNISNK